ncbi:MAG TPA: hypothetical protein VMN37_03870, partial [Gemmatimonadales bacterium]|nr:hypothetical protein [Gemmatimonadales bacterium]
GWLALALLLLAPPAAAQDRAAIVRMADSLVPYVQGASGLVFQYAPRLGVRTRAEVRQYVAAALEQAYPHARLAAVATAYHLLGLLPDTAGFARLILDLHAEELRGYFDPVSDSLFAVAGATPAQLREVLAHEMVHAAQAQYVDLGPAAQLRRDNDERTAFVALIEGQATFATMRLFSPRRNIVAESALWEYVAAHLRAEPMARPAYRRAPLWVREGLLAPYIYGAQFANYWQASDYADTLPYGPRTPRSTEQILHFARYDAGDQPVSLRFAADSGAGVLAEDVLGELEIQILAAQVAGARSLGRLSPIGWGGDRYRVLEAPDGAALVWYAVWDDPESAAAFAAGTGAALSRRRKPGYRAAFDTLTVGTLPATRYVLAPEGWEGWAAVPEVRVR